MRGLSGTAAAGSGRGSGDNIDARRGRRRRGCGSNSAAQRKVPARARTYRDLCGYVYTIVNTGILMLSGLYSTSARLDPPIRRPPRTRWLLLRVLSSVSSKKGVSQPNLKPVDRARAGLAS